MRRAIGKGCPLQSEPGWPRRAGDRRSVDRAGSDPGRRPESGRGGGTAEPSQELGLSPTGSAGTPVSGSPGRSESGFAESDSGASWCGCRGQPGRRSFVVRRESLNGDELRGVIDLLLASGTSEKKTFVLEKPRLALEQAAGLVARSWDPRAESRPIEFTSSWDICWNNSVGSRTGCLIAAAVNWRRATLRSCVRHSRT